MARKKVIISVSVLLAAVILAAVIILIQPEEKVINETVRFYHANNVQYGNSPDDTDFTELTDKVMDVNLDLTILKGIGGYYISGSVEAGGEKLNICAQSPGNTVNGTPGLFAGMQHKNIYNTSSMRITDDLEHIELDIFYGEAKGMWVNTETLGDYKKLIKELYHIDC